MGAERHKVCRLRNKILIRKYAQKAKHAFLFNLSIKT